MRRLFLQTPLLPIIIFALENPLKDTRPQNCFFEKKCLPFTNKVYWNFSILKRLYPETFLNYSWLENFSSFLQCLSLTNRVYRNCITLKRKKIKDSFFKKTAKKTFFSRNLLKRLFFLNHLWPQNFNYFKPSPDFPPSSSPFKFKFPF